MTDLLTLAVQEVNAGLRPALLIFLRVAAAMAVLPAFGEQSIPRRLRLGAALAFTAILAPIAADRYTGTGLLLPAFGETLAGLLIGLSLRLMILALQTAASTAAQSASLSQLFPVAGSDPLPALGTLMTLGALALALQADLHLRLVELFLISYDLLPAGRIPDASAVAAWGVGRVGHAMSLAFTLAAPFVVAGLVWNIALGIVNRAMPQLMLSFVGAPALAWGALVLAALTVPLILSVWLRAFSQVLADPFGGG